MWYVRIDKITTPARIIRTNTIIINRETCTQKINIANCN